jgi:hypothetical protein
VLTIDVGQAGNLSLGGGISIIGQAGGGGADLSGIFASISRNTSAAARLDAQTVADNRALHCYSNTASRTEALVLIENDNGTGSGVGLEIQNDASGPHIDLTGVNGTGIEIDGNLQLIQKTFEIGDWNMDSTASIGVAHGLTLANIRAISALLRDDANTTYYAMPWMNVAPGASSSADGISVGATNVNLDRTTGGFFDNTNFDATTFNRGWITVSYVL